MSGIRPPDWFEAVRGVDDGLHVLKSYGKAISVQLVLCPCIIPNLDVVELSPTGLNCRNLLANSCHTTAVDKDLQIFGKIIHNCNEMCGVLLKAKGIVVVVCTSNMQLVAICLCSALYAKAFCICLLFRWPAVFAFRVTCTNP